MEKLIYTSPVLEIIEFDEEDIMTASTNQWDDKGLFDKDATSWWD